MVNQGSGAGKSPAGVDGVSSSDFVIPFHIDVYYRGSNYKLSVLELFTSDYQLSQTKVSRTIHQYSSVKNTITTPNIH